MSARAARVPRGQAIVESVLAMLVFITVLVFGIHFAEITVTSMKVTEAGQAAVWDSTSGQMHSLPLSFGAVNGVVTGAGSTAMTRYTDFEGRQNATPSAIPKGLFSRAVPGSMNVRCRTGAGLNQRAGHLALILSEAAVYADNGGMQCQADAYLDPFGTMRLQAGLNDFGFFAKGTGGTRASRIGSNAFTAGYHVCEVGRPAGAGCRGNFEMLIDDWGLASGGALGSESSTCPVLPFGLPCVGLNMPFWLSGNLMYNLQSLLFTTQDNSDLAMVRLVGNPPGWTWWGTYFTPGHPTSFYMSFMGENTAFIQPTIPPGDGGWAFWFTTPFGLYFPTYSYGWNAGRECYLGRDNCNTGLISDP